jgi:hypothetical protein
VDREGIAREVRRRQVREMLDFEREREQTLTEQVELVIGEADGAGVDAAVYARMSPEDVEIVDAELNPPTWESEEDELEFIERDDLVDFDEEGEIDLHAEELARLDGELEDCRRRQVAFQAYLDALDG